MSSIPQAADLLQQGKQCLRQGKFAEAVDAFQQLIAVEPSHVVAHEGLANAHFALKNYESAVETFQQVSRLDPRQGRALINLGAVFNRMGEYGKALDALRRGLQKDRSIPQGYYNMGLAHRGLNQLSMSISAYREAIRLDKNMAEAHQNLANALVEMGSHQQAISHYEKALEIQPSFKRAERGLESVREAMEAKKESMNPFGRLVNTADAHNQQKKTTSIRNLTDEERIEDRETVAAMAIGISDAATELLVQFQKTLEPCLLRLNREVAQGKKGSFNIIDAHEDFSAGAKENSALRHLLKKRMQDLKNHMDSLRVK